NIKDLIARNSLTGKNDETAKWLVLLGAAFNKTVDALAKYGAALDVLSQTNDILCPIWGAMRIFLIVRHIYLAEQPLNSECRQLKANGSTLIKFTNGRTLLPSSYPFLGEQRSCTLLIKTLLKN